jgi:hypothetical protein
MLNWSRQPAPSPAEIRAAVRQKSGGLRLLGLHSVAVLPQEGECAAVMISRGDDERAARRLASAILPDADLRIESMRVDDGPSTPVWSGDTESPPPSRRPGLALSTAVVLER